MTTTIGSLDINTFNDLYSDSNQYFWFESDSSATYGAGAHVTLVPDTTFISNPTGQNILMNTDGISIRNGLLPMMTLDNNSLDFNMIDTVGNTYTNAASFGISSTIGLTNGTQSYLYEDYHSLQMVSKENNVYFHVSDLRNKDGDIVEKFEGDGNTQSFTLSFYPNSITEVLVDDVPQESGTDYWIEDSTVFFTNYPSDGSIVTFTYATSSENAVLAKAFTFGSRKQSGIGGHSFATGVDNEASGYASHAEGDGSVASGANSHAEGHWSYAIGTESHAEGFQCKARGNHSHAQNVFTIANGDGQTAIGSANIADTTSLFIIGNGQSDTRRSNALTVDWSGNVEASGDVTDGGGNVLSAKANTSSLSAVATSGDYDDLTNLPTIPTKTSDLTNDSNFVGFESGTATAGSVTWEYRKWADGTLEMWGRAITKLNINTAVGNIYTTANEYNIAVPSFVDSVDFVTGELSGGGWVDVTGYGVPPKMRFYAPTAYTSTDRYLRYYLKGTWS